MFKRFLAKQAVAPSPTTPVVTPQTIIDSMVSRLSETDTPENEQSPSFSEESPEVSIVILNFNESHLTLRAVREIHKNTQETPFDITVVDNGSDPVDFEKLATSNLKFKLLRLKYNRHTIEGNNIGAESAKGKFIYFLSPKVFVKKDWLFHAVERLRHDDTVGAMGPKILYADGTIKAAGVSVHEDGAPRLLGNGQDSLSPEFNQPMEVDGLSMLALLLRKRDFEDLGGFDMAWEPSYLEDLDMCFKIRALGKKICYEPRSVAYSAIMPLLSSSSDSPANISELLNQSKFIKRWGPALNNRNQRPATEGATTPVFTRDQSRPIAGIYTPYSLVPGGGERVLLSFISALAEKYDIILFLDEIYSQYRIKTLFKELNVPPSALQVRKLHSAPQERLDYFLCLGNEVAPPTPGLSWKNNTYICQFPFPFEPHVLASRWDHLKTYSQIVVYSEYAKTHLLAAIKKYNLPSKEIVVLYPPSGTPMTLSQPPQDAGDTIRLLSIGRFFRGGHCKNHHETVDLVDKLIKLAPDMKFELHIAGTVHAHENSWGYFNEVQEKAKGLPVYLHPNADSSEIEKLLKESSIYIHATGFKQDSSTAPESFEHFGIAIVEAMNYGILPIAFGIGGPCEIIQDGVNGLLFLTEGEFLEKILGLLRDKERLTQLKRAANLRASAFSDETFRNAIIKNDLR